MIGRSIRARIQIWHTALLASLTAGLLIAFYFHEKEIMERDFDQTIMSEITAAIPQFAPMAPERNGPPANFNRGPRSNPSERRPPKDFSEHPPQNGSKEIPENHRLRGPLGHRAAPIDETPEEEFERKTQSAQILIEKGLYVASVDRDGSVSFSSINAPSEIPPPQQWVRTERQPVYMRDNGNNRECIHNAPGGTSVLIGASKDILVGQLVNLKWILFLIGGTTILVGFTVGWFLVGRSLRPIDSISKTASEIAAGDLSKRINLNETESELGQMGEVLNETFFKLESAFDQQVRFTSDASHELRTPIAVILAKCQFALRKDRESEKYKDALKTCETSAQHIRNLVESLLELAKVDSGEFQVLKQDGDLKNIAENCVDLLSTLAEQKDIEIKSELEQTRCWIDTDRVQQVTINLLSNAIKYTPSGGSIQVTTKFTGAACELTIKDSGLGIHPDDIPHLFDRFYRVNSDRSQDQRSTGLGLAITKAIVIAHGGDIQVSSKLGHGSSFKVTLPADTDSLRSKHDSLADLHRKSA